MNYGIIQLAASSLSILILAPNDLDLEDPVQLGSFVCREATVGDKSMLP